MTEITGPGKGAPAYKRIDATILPIWDSLGTPYADNTEDPLRPLNVGYEVLRRRFSDAELAAQYWMANGSSSIRAYKRDEKGNIIDIHGEGWEYECEVMLRFAITPDAFDPLKPR
jgi:hypothetical protein